VKAEAKNLLLLHLLFFVYALSSALGKAAARSEFLSVFFLLYMVMAVALMAVYAIAWQHILRRFTLTDAYSHRGIITVWGVLFGAAFFRERVNAATLVALSLVVAGVFVIGRNEHV